MCALYGITFIFAVHPFDIDGWKEKESIKLKLIERMAVIWNELNYWKYIRRPIYNAEWSSAFTTLSSTFCPKILMIKNFVSSTQSVWFKVHFSFVFHLFLLFQHSLCHSLSPSISLVIDKHSFLIRIKYLCEAINFLFYFIVVVYFYVSFMRCTYARTME